MTGPADTLHMRSIREVVSRLKANPHVVGLIEYGNAHWEDQSLHGDYDLIVVLERRDPELEGIHFFVGDTPVDLSIRTLADIRDATVIWGLDPATIDNRVIYDPSGSVAKAVAELNKHAEAKLPSPMTSDAIAHTRHGTRHIFDKIRDRKESMPALCAYLLHQNVYWLVRTYFCVRGLPFEGEKRAFEYFENHEPSLFSLLESFFGTSDIDDQVDSCKQIAKIVLAPVGGMWRSDEILAFGDQELGREAFRRLFGNQQSETSTRAGGDHDS